jgi:hypothetical protein
MEEGKCKSPARKIPVCLLRAQQPLRTREEHGEDLRVQEVKKEKYRMRKQKKLFRKSQ